MIKEEVKTPTFAGGGEIVESPYIRVAFQSGIPTEVGINGCRVEDVINVAIHKLERFQDGPLACEENAEALRFLRLARHSLADRIQHRKEQGVWNTMIPHMNDRTEDENDDFSATGA
ncbi:MAG: hypothetical protein P4L46_08775 [Fimbriimonas sp.]|nr:hypothetical protein [Fimbriimonas sp.]